MLERFFPNADLAFGVLGTELWSPAGLAFATKIVRRLGRKGFAAFTGDLLQTSRDWLGGRRSRPSARMDCSHRGCFTPGSGRMPRQSGFMTQVIAVAVQEGVIADPARRRREARRRELVQLIRDHGGTCETGVDRRARAREERSRHRRAHDERATSSPPSRPSSRT